MLSMLSSICSDPGYAPQEVTGLGEDAYDCEDELLDVEDLEDEGVMKTDSRKSSKPVMEKRRRARINHCLTELKTLIVDALNQDPARHSKLEKADILELTVQHLQRMQRRQLGAAVARDPTVLHKFRGGFSECVQEVNRYVTRIDSVDGGVKQRLMSHLGQCVTGLRAMTPGTFAAMAGVPLQLPPPPNMRPSFPRQQFAESQVQKEPSDSQSRALQNLLISRMAPRPPPGNIAAPLFKQTATDVRKMSVSPKAGPHPTPNTSPQSSSSFTLSLPITPQSTQVSPTSSLLGSSPDSSSQSPPQLARPVVTKSTILSVMPSEPTTKPKFEEPSSFGHLFSSTNRVSAFTAVKSHSSISSSSVSLNNIPLQIKQEAQIVAEPPTRKLLPEGIVAPTARRLVAGNTNDAIIKTQSELYPVLNSQGVPIKGEKSADTNVLRMSEYMRDQNDIANNGYFPSSSKQKNNYNNANTCNYSSSNSQIGKPSNIATTNCSVMLPTQTNIQNNIANNASVLPSFYISGQTNPVNNNVMTGSLNFYREQDNIAASSSSRKRSLDSACEYDQKPKIVKVEVVKGGPSSLPLPGVGYSFNSTDRKDCSQQRPLIAAPAQEEKDMWRPW